jgi:branched-chain amino acid transport system substrate-binding protein
MKFSLKQIALGTAIAASSLSALAADTIKIGSVLSVTGPAAFLGDPELKTLQLYVEAVSYTHLTLPTK